MLQTLKIKNVALIDELEINFSEGLNLLLGETGAGKSIIFDALNFVLGAKADKTLIRTGEEMMRVDAVFSGLSKSASHALLLAGAIEEDCTEVMLMRSFDVSGKNSCRINGVPVTSLMLKTCGEVLVDSYSQHESLDLLKSKNHLAMLDRLGGEKIRALKDKTATEFQNYQKLLKEKKMLGGEDRERTMSILDYQIKEIEEANLVNGEAEEIKSRLNYLENIEKIVEVSRESEELLTNSSMSAVNEICQTVTLLNQISGVEEISDCINRLNGAKYELEDISETLKGLCDEDFDEGEYERLDRRNDLIKSLCRKYGGTIEKCQEFLAKAKEDYSALASAEQRLCELEKEEKLQEAKLDEACSLLSQARKEVALDIEQKLMCQLQDLGMKSTKFVVNFSRQNYSANGFDDVEFNFSANKGEEVKALSKTASGGEISRVMLAFKTIFASVGLAQTLIFDEIDTGISGEVGNVVGEKLKSLAGSQVICVTHLAQVACHGDVFFFVSKTDDGHKTYTSIRLLEGDEINYQLARMIGGDSVTEVALNHVRQMRERAQACRKA